MQWRSLREFFGEGKKSFERVQSFTFPPLLSPFSPFAPSPPHHGGKRREKLFLLHRSNENFRALAGRAFRAVKTFLPFLACKLQRRKFLSEWEEAKEKIFALFAIIDVRQNVALVVIVAIRKLFSVKNFLLAAHFTAALSKQQKNCLIYGIFSGADCTSGKLFFPSKLYPFAK